MIKRLLAEKYNIEDNIIDFVCKCENELNPKFRELDEIKEYNQYKVLSALQKTEFPIFTSAGERDTGMTTREETPQNRFMQIFLIQKQHLSDPPS